MEIMANTNPAIEKPVLPLLICIIENINANIENIGEIIQINIEKNNAHNPKINPAIPNPFDKFSTIIIVHKIITI